MESSEATFFGKVYPNLKNYPRLIYQEVKVKSMVLFHVHVVIK